MTPAVLITANANSILLTRYSSRRVRTSMRLTAADARTAPSAGVGRIASAVGQEHDRDRQGDGRDDARQLGLARIRSLMAVRESEAVIAKPPNSRRRRWLPEADQLAVGVHGYRTRPKLRAVTIPGSEAHDRPASALGRIRPIEILWDRQVRQGHARDQP
jgi:hypothetical protein